MLIHTLYIELQLLVPFSVIRLDGSVPQKYGLRLNMDEKYRVLKKELSTLTNIPSQQILLVEIVGPVVKVTVLLQIFGQVKIVLQFEILGIIFCQFFIQCSSFFTLGGHGHLRSRSYEGQGLIFINHLTC